VKRFRLLIAAAVLAVFAWACDPLPLVQQIYHHAVYVVGDSITVLSAQQIKDAFRGDDVIVQARPWINVEQGLGLLRSYGGGVAARIVRALGSNDGNPPADFGPQIDEVMAYIHSLNKPVQVWWVNVSTLINPAYAAVNDAISAATLRYRNLRVIDSASVAAAHPEYLYDGLHCNPLGCAVRTELITQAVGR
jgi:hypothetical protein